MAKGGKGGRPTNGNDQGLIKLEIGVEPKLLEYLDDLVQKQGFGNSRSAVARQFIWQEVNRLIGNRLDER